MYLEKYNFEELIHILNSQKGAVILFGAGNIGKLTFFVFRKLGIEVTYFCDNSIHKQGTFHQGVKIIAPAQLKNISKEAFVFICGNYLKSISELLVGMGFSSIYTCGEVLKTIDFSKDDTGFNPLYAQRIVANHIRECAKQKNHRLRQINLKYLDVVITEACTMKCVDCSNLMQYYQKPKHSDLEVLFNSLDKIMASIDSLFEFRVLGGEPFMNKQMYRVIDKLLTFEQVEKIVIFTNGTIVPKGQNLMCLTDDRIIVYLTYYEHYSRNFDRLVDVFDQQSINYIKKIPSWQDCGRINFRTKTEDELKFMFENCCVNDVLTLLNGKLYRCPFSANGTNLGGIPYDTKDIIDLEESTKNISEIRAELAKLYFEKDYLTACSYCNGRDYRTPKIEVALQTKFPLPVIKV